MRIDSRRILFEVVVLYIGGLVVLYGTGLLAGLGGAFAENQGAFTAAYFLLVPVALLRWRGKDPANFGIHGRKTLAGLFTILVTAAVIFPPYVAGYEVWSRWQFDRSFQVPTHPLEYFPSEWRGRPEFLPEARGLHVWVEGESLRALYRGGRRVNLDVSGCGCPARRMVLVPGGRLAFKGTAGLCEEGHLEVGLVDGTGFTCPVSRASRLLLKTLDDPAPPVLAGAGAVLKVENPVPVPRTAWWLLELLLLHLIVVAFPEEVFYRGYLQTRLAPLFRGRRRILGVSMGWHVVVASGLFALSHLVLIPSPGRLLVFFPGLLFGYLRERTGSVVAPAVLHALSNVLVEVLIRYHSV